MCNPEYSPQHFFDLSAFSHRALFSGCTFVWQALENIATYLKAQPLGVHLGTIHQGAILVNPELISIGEGTVVEAGAYIAGPCIIGSYCQIRHAAYIRGNCIIGNHSVIGHTTEIKNSIMLDHAHAAHFAYLGDSILGNHTNLGAGVKCANLRLKGDEIIVNHNAKCTPTGRRKLGAIIGDFSQVGCNSVLNPGTLFSKRVQCHPGVCVSGYVAENGRVRSQVKPVIQTTEN